MAAITSPQVVQADYPTAHRLALSSNEPIFVPVNHFADERGWSLMNLLQGVLSPQGQINYSTMYPGVIKAWHRHQRQTDFWLGLHGHLKAGVYRESDGKMWLTTLGEKRPGVLIIPPPLWHGLATIGHELAGLLYFVTHSYDPKNLDEERRAFDSVSGFPWTVRHG